MLLPLLLTLLTGCQQARSYLHMNSDSPSPFLGLELSVDARDAQRGRTPQNDGLTQAKSAGDCRHTLVRFTTPQRSEDFVPTSESRSLDGDLKYSLPVISLKAGGAEAEEAEAIIRRFSGT
ncbi:MAG: hypothetical protein R3C59_25745 [Planctomycetaceae bacterium]